MFKNKIDKARNVAAHAVIKHANNRALKAQKKHEEENPFTLHEMFKGVSYQEMRKMANTPLNEMKFEF